MTVAPQTTNGAENERLYRTLEKSASRQTPLVKEIANSLLTRIYLRELQTTELLNLIAIYLDEK